MQLPTTRALLPAVVFALTAFLLMPLAVLGQRTYAAVDMLEPKAPYREGLAESPRVVSPLQSDQAETLAGPAAFFRALRHGTFQRWDPHVAAGNPTGILPVGGLLSPFSIGYVFLPAWYAVTLKVVLSLLFCQAFTYLLLRRLGTGQAAAILSAVAYTYTGANLVLIHRVNAVFLLPALLWAVHRLVAGPQPTARSSLRATAVLALLVAWTWFEGFPSGFVYCVYVTAAWAAWLAVRRRSMRSLALAAGGVVWGVAIACVSLVPLVSEVLARGTLEARSGGADSSIPRPQFFGLFDLSGTGPPVEGPWWGGLNGVESTSHVGMIVVGAVAMGLLGAALGRLRLHRDGAEAWTFFCGLAVVGVVLNYVGGPLLTLAYRLPGIADNPINRSRFVISMATAVLGGLAADAWWRRRAGEEAARAGPRAVSLLAVCAIGAVTVWFAPGFVRAASAAGQLTSVARGFTVALVMAGAAALLARLGSRPAITLGLAGLLFAQLGWPLRNFTPQAPVRDFYAEQAGHRTLRRLLDGRYRFAAAGFDFYPNSGQVHRLPDLRGQALHPAEFKAVIEASNPSAFAHDPLKIDLRRHEWNLDSALLDHLAVRYFALPTTDLPFATARDYDLTWDRWAPVAGLPPSATTGVAPGRVGGALVPLRARGRCSGESVRLSLVSGGTTVASATRRAFDLEERWTPFALTAQRVAAGDPYRFEITPSSPGCVVEVGMVGERVARQVLVEDPDQPVRLVATEGAWIYERPHAWELVSAHTRWQAFASQEELLAAAAGTRSGEGVPAFVGAGPAPEDGGGRATVDSYRIRDNRVDVEVTGDRITLVAVSQNASDGWTAEVDGRPAPLVAVDGALLGVFVPPGRHSMELRYLPRSFVYGSAVSATGVVAAAAVLLATKRRRAHPGRRPPVTLATDGGLRGP